MPGGAVLYLQLQNEWPLFNTKLSFSWGNSALSLHFQHIKNNLAYIYLQFATDSPCHVLPKSTNASALTETAGKVELATANAKKLLFAHKGNQDSTNPAGTLSRPSLLASFTARTGKPFSRTGKPFFTARTGKPFSMSI